MNTYEATIRDIELLRTAQIVMDLQSMNDGEKTEEVNKALLLIKKLASAITVSKNCPNCGQEEIIYVTYK